MLYDVRASIHDAEGHSDGAYDLIGDSLAADEVANRIREALAGDFDLLTNAKPPLRLSISIGPAGTGYDLPID